MRCGAQLGTISVDPGPQSTWSNWPKDVLPVTEREDGVVALHLPIGLFKTPL